MSPRRQRAAALACLAVSVVLWPLAHLTGWIRSVIFVNELSLAAIVLGCVIWVAASHLDVKRDEEDVAGEVVERLKQDPSVPTTED